MKSDTVSVIDGKTNTVIGSPIPAGDRSSGITFNPNNGDLYVANVGPTTGCCGTVSAIEGKTNTVIGSPIPVGFFPQTIAFNPDNGDIYVDNRN